MRKLPKITISYEQDFEQQRQETTQAQTESRIEGELGSDTNKSNSKIDTVADTSNIFSNTPSTLEMFKTKKISLDPDSDDNGEAFVDFLSNFRSKDVLTESSLTEDETIEPPTTKLAAQQSNGVALDKLMKKIDRLENMEAPDTSSPCLQPKRGLFFITILT